MAAVVHAILVVILAVLCMTVALVTGLKVHAAAIAEGPIRETLAIIVVAKEVQDVHLKEATLEEIAAALANRTVSIILLTIDTVIPIAKAR